MYILPGGEEKVSPSGIVARQQETIEFYSQLREIFISGLAFQGVGFVSALRHMLTQSGFRMPGEAQKVSRFLEAFALCYYSANKDGNKDSGLDKDKCEILAFATVMLNTDRYNPAIKAKKKMTLKQFKSNMRGMGITDAFLETVFADIIAEEILMPRPGQPTDTKGKGGKGSKGGKGGKGNRGDHDDSDDDDNGDHALSLFYRSMQNAAQRARAKLSGHSSMCRVYFTKMSTELVNLMFEISWPFFYRCITVVLDEQENSERRGDEVNHLELVACVLDLLRYSISACLCLGMETERRAFAALLAKFHFLHSNSGEWDSVGDVMMFGHEDDDNDPQAVVRIDRSHSTRSAVPLSTPGTASGGLGGELKRGATMTKDILSGKHLEQVRIKATL